ncbi:hypothetical protein CC78DRAFT_590584 [Lojkania enalia]|uniref:Uncharacterized protein n=1 Tax=Lojkania enalia TaxID=147567 RepID=A0A9P4K2K2_9PLEO|nr:hypothetical protein CC78DRAFT_590584 [Didymosphaeria enalia]
MAICRYYQQGHCLNGDTCYYQHPSGRPQQSSSTPPLNISASSFRPSSRSPAYPHAKTPCVFFQQGSCKKGFLCKYEHEVAAVAPPTVPKDGRSHVVCTFFQRNACKKGDTYITLRSIGGAKVTFGSGAAVSVVSLSSDFSAVLMSNIPVDVPVPSILGVLATYGFPDLPSECVQLRQLPNSRQAAHIKVANPDFAGDFLHRASSNIDFMGTSVQISLVQLAGHSDSSMNKLQLCGVHCSWYNPSKAAYLHFGNDDIARNALKNTEKRKHRQLHGRNVTFKYQPVRSLQVGNLDPRTTKEELERFLPRPLPREIVWGSLSHVMTAEQMQEQVKASLEARGELTDWVLSTQKGGPRVKATAKFTKPESARAAVKELNGTPIDRTSNDLLRVALVTSIKFSVSDRVLKTVRAELDTLAEKSWKSGYVTIKMYENIGKPYTQIRVYGESKDSVARAKASVEQLLAGHVAVYMDAAISDAFFFMPSSDSFLEDIMKTFRVLIIRDLRRMVLRIYGDAKAIARTQDRLIDKVRELEVQSHPIPLDPTSWRVAMKGGLREVISRFGKDKVKIDVVSNPKRIIVKGSEKERSEALEILQQYSTRPLEQHTSALSVDDSEELCPVCWTPPDEPFKTGCRHTYCRSCLESQCTSAGEGDFPICCLGDSTNCGKPLSLPELSDVLPLNTYEVLLRSSFNGYIRRRPTEFHYCPTPDCDHFYRSANASKPRIFDCDGCLSSICTGCHNTTHDGMSCETYKNMMKTATDGLEEFAKWKENNDVRDCPKCGVPIEKSEGCNHMHCRSCDTHICWFCMKTFRNGQETYKHMGNRHTEGGWLF